MALNKLKFNSINVTPAAGKGIRFNSSANGLETASAGGNLVKIASTTASSSSSISFTSGIDSTYKEYIFFFNNIHPQTNTVQFDFNVSADGGSNYNVVRTSTFFNAYHNEDDSGTSLGYGGNNDLAQALGGSQTFGEFGSNLGNGNDECMSGYLHLFEPSSTTFVKHYIGTSNIYHQADLSIVNYFAGYANSTSAINAIQFLFDSGNIDAGTITMYGVT